jgi:hypothetical protein
MNSRSPNSISHHVMSLLKTDILVLLIKEPIRNDMFPKLIKAFFYKIETDIHAKAVEMLMKIKVFKALGEHLCILCCDWRMIIVRP